MENVAPFDINKGLDQTPMKIDHQRSLIDTATCQTYTEVIVTEMANPYAFGTRLRVNHEKIAEIEIIWKRRDIGYLTPMRTCSIHPQRNGTPIPGTSADTRETWSPPPVPISMHSRRKDGHGAVGPPLQSHGGGAHTRRGVAEDTCQSGVPKRCEHFQRRFVVDETIALSWPFWPPLAPVIQTEAAVHRMRTSSGWRLGKLRYVHTLTQSVAGKFPGRWSEKSAGAPAQCAQRRCGRSGRRSCSSGSAVVSK